MIEYQEMRGTQDLREGDIPAINALLAALTTRDIQTHRDALAGVMYRAQFVVARDIAEERRAPIVGMGTMNLISTVKGSYGWIDDVVVLPSHEGRGIGTAIVERLLEQARNLGLAYVELTSGKGEHRTRANCVYCDKLKGTLRDTNVYRWTFWEESERRPG